MPGRRRETTGWVVSSVGAPYQAKLLPAPAPASAGRRGGVTTVRMPGAVAARVMASMLLLAIAVGCGGATPPAPRPTSVPSSVPAAGGGARTAQTPGPPAEPCAGGRLAVGDLAAVEAAREQGLAAATDEAKAWQNDARLVGLQVSCRLLGTGFRWQATFSSERARAVMLTGSGEIDPIDDPKGLPDLPSGDLSFTALQRSLRDAGYGDRTELTAAGIIIRPNTERAPFGPPDAPKDAVYYHVAVVDRGEVKDLFVAADDGTVYRYGA